MGAGAGELRALVHAACGVALASWAAAVLGAPWRLWVLLLCAEGACVALVAAAARGGAPSSPPSDRAGGAPARRPGGGRVARGGSRGRLCSPAALVEAGVPQEEADGVEELASRLGVTGPEPLADPLTLLRFWRARDGDPDAAEEMYREAVAWRRELPMAGLMALHGSGDSYAADGCSRREGADGTAWLWRRGLGTDEAALAQRHGFWGRLSAPEPGTGAPVAVWRMGRCDWDGLARAGLIERLQGAFAAHLEDLLQAGRAASRRQGRLVRARVIVDCSGLGRDALRHRAESKKFLSLGKRYFPEVTASITVVRAPRVFTLCFGFVRPMLTEAMRRKICIFGEDFEEGLRAHSGLPLAALPAFLGGKADDGEVCSAEPVPP